jgi:hypothetical protein
VQTYEAAIAACGLKRLAKSFRELPPAMKASIAKTVVGPDGRFTDAKFEACFDQAGDQAP